MLELFGLVVDDADVLDGLFIAQLLRLGFASEEVGVVDEGRQRGLQVVRYVRDEFRAGPLFLNCFFDRFVQGLPGDGEVPGEGLEGGRQTALVDRDIGVCAGGGDDLIEPPQVLDQPGQDIEAAK